MPKEWRGRPSKRALALVREQLAHGPKRGGEIIQAADLPRQHLGMLADRGPQVRSDQAGLTSAMPLQKREGGRRRRSENGMDRPCSRPASEYACCGAISRRNQDMSCKSNPAVVCIGIDPGKNTLHLVGLDARGAIVLREKVARSKIVSRLANVPPCLIGIEAGMGTHYMTRELLALDHDVRQVPPIYAKPFRQSHKNDFRDAHAIAEAVQRPTTRCVPPKTDEQLDLQALHRVRYRLVGQRTAIINQIRCFLLEHGITVRQRLHWLRHALPDVLAQRTDVLSPRMVRILEDLAQDWRRLDDRIETVTDEIEALSKNTEPCRHLMTIPGIGPIISSAVVAAIGNGTAFTRGRDFAAWLGLVPKQISTGDRTILGRITKRGNRYLRMLFMQAARVVLLRPRNWMKHGFGPWLAAAAQRLHHNVLATALANKLARIAWSVLVQDRVYETRLSAAAV
jgi:transposase